MIGVWSLEGSWNELLIGGRTSFEQEQLEDALLPMLAAGEVGRWFDDPVARGHLVEIFEQLATHVWPAPATTAEEIRELLVPAIEEAFRSGRLVAIPVVSTRVGATVLPEAPQEEEAPPAPARAEREEPSWITIELVDEDGEPVPHQRFRVTAANGVVREGVLDARGSASVRDIPSGDCVVTFLDLDDETWSVA